MDVTTIRILSAVGLPVVGVVTVAGAMAVSFLAAWLIEPGLAVIAWVERLRGRGAEPPRPARTELAPGVSPGLGFDAGAEHALLGRQAQQASWRLRC
jgi:hypothetical protein